MLRLVIQISMGLALPLMAVLPVLKPHLAPWYIAYVLLFNMLVGPVFTAGSVTSERERQTLDLLAHHAHHPLANDVGQAVRGPPRVERAHAFLMWPVLLACIMPLDYWYNLPTMGGYFLVVLLACITTAMTALFCSTLFAKTSSSLLCDLFDHHHTVSRAARCPAVCRLRRGTTRRRVSNSRGSAAPSPRCSTCRSKCRACRNRSRAVSLPVFYGHLFFAWSTTRCSYRRSLG